MYKDASYSFAKERLNEPLLLFRFWMNDVSGLLLHIIRKSFNTQNVRSINQNLQGIHGIVLKKG